jgi:hypothetical protein
MSTALAKSIVDMNIGMLYLARESLLQDRLAGMATLGIGDEVASCLLDMSTEQLHRLAHIEVLLVGLRWRAAPVWQRLGEFANGKTTALAQALVVGESELRHGH